MNATSMGAASKKSQAHLKRWITGLSALSALILCVVAGGITFSALTGLAGLICLWEYFRMVCPVGTRLMAQPVLVAGYAAHVSLMIVAHFDRPIVFPVILGLNLIICGFISLWRFPSEQGVLEVVAKEIQGICYISLALALLIVIRSRPDGMTWLFFLCAVIFAGDTAALYCGSLWGRHKLSPSISPGKTVEGALGGLAVNLLVSAMGKALFLPEAGWFAVLLFGAAVGIVGQAGDLFESELKRAANLKDSGAVLPGHGGMLDRLDALLFAAPVAFCFGMYIGTS